jgi:predicted XRE-type DNA-binding protein
VEDRERDGTFIWGAADSKSKLTEEQVRFIRQYKKQFTQQYMANLFGVDRKTVNDVLVGNTWTRLL